jgi:hypothetical protein
MSARVLRLIPMLSICLVMQTAWAASETYRHAAVVPEPHAPAIAQRIVALLVARLEEAGADVQTGRPAGPDGVTIYIGMPERHPELEELCRVNRLPMPNILDPGPEGYRLVATVHDTRPVLLAVCMDERGMLYAAGEILRQLVKRPGGVEFPVALDVRGVARWPVRGSLVHQGHTITELTNARHWTDDELERAMLDYALAGANTFEVTYQPPDGRIFTFIKSYGLDTLMVPVANSGAGPEEWQALEAIGRTGYLCPSVPEARQALLNQWEARFKNMAPMDYIHWKSGDGGGCECDTCAPYGAVFVRLCEDLTRILHNYHPNTKVFIGNQKLDSAGDIAILDYLKEEPRDWVRGIVYGPGSNAMGWMPGRRQDHRMDLFQYARHGQVEGFLRELLHQLPPDKEILLFSDLTHWIYSQWGTMDHFLIADRDYHVPPAWDRWLYERVPDRAMRLVYNRRTFHARPRAYYEAFQHVMRYGIGDVAYSEGYHDHLHVWMWQRLMWNPRQSVEEVVHDYARQHFGPEAASLMVEAIFTLEQNIVTPIADNPGIDRFNSLVFEAGATMPEQYMSNNFLWRQYAQRALIDGYIQRMVRLQDQRMAGVMTMLADALNTGRLDETLGAVIARIEEDLETDDMRRLKEEADRLGQESDVIFGVRNEGLFNLDRDFAGIAWVDGEVRRAQAAPEEDRRAIVHQIVHYDDPGPGGFYDDAGNADNSPNLVYGWPRRIGFGRIRESQAIAAYTTDEPRGVTFHYMGLDPDAQYRIRFTLFRPPNRTAPGRVLREHPEKRQSIYADGHCLAKDLELPVGTPELFEFEIPQELTADGELTVWFEKEDGIGDLPPGRLTAWSVTGGWGTLVSEAWLMKR